MAHVFNHILYKALLFMAIGVIVWKTGENALSRVGGLQKKMPVTAFAFWVAAFSISGVPLFNGFVSKGMVLMAAEGANIWLWVLLEIASFGTFLSFLKLGYFAFIRPGDTKGSDPPVLMQAGMIGAALLCILIGVFPGILYAILPYPTTYQAYAPLPLLSAGVVLGAALLFFVTVGVRWLEPHDVGIKDFDTIYRVVADGLMVCAAGVMRLFSGVYRFAVSCATGLFVAGIWCTGMENRDVNWNIAMFGGVLIAFIAVILIGVGV